MIKFQLQVDKNCNATPIATQQQIPPTGPPVGSVNQNVSASLTTNAIRQPTEQVNPHIHYINMQKQNQGTINSGGVTNKVIECDILASSFAQSFIFPIPKFIQSLSNDLLISQFKQQSVKADKKSSNEANQNEASPVKRRSTSQMDVSRNFCFQNYEIYSNSIVIE